MVGLVLEDDLREAHARSLLGVKDAVFQLLDDRQDTIEFTKQRRCLFIILGLVDHRQESKEGDFLQALYRSIWVAFIDQLVEVDQKYKPLDNQ